MLHKLNEANLVEYSTGRNLVRMTPGGRENRKADDPEYAAFGSAYERCTQD